MVEGGDGHGGQSNAAVRNLPVLALLLCLPGAAAEPVRLKDVYADAFGVGVAVQAAQLERGVEAKLVQRHFSMVVAEYQMKANVIAPREGEYDWRAADAIVEYAEAHGMTVRGHALVWHESTPEWFLAGGDPQVVRERLETYIRAVVGRYRGRVFAWDVVNEAVGSDGLYRDNAWHRIAGADYVDWAFHAARAADPDCLLFLNDYGTERAGKLDRLMRVADKLRERGVPLDGIGHQFHIAHDQHLAGIETALDAVAAAGLANHITELDISAYKDPGSCFRDGTACEAALRDDEVAAFLDRQADVYRAVFQAASERPSVSAVLVWGLHDGQSWLNRFPAPRPNHPLLFDRDLRPKPAFWALTTAEHAP